MPHFQNAPDHFIIGAFHMDRAQMFPDNLIVFKYFFLTRRDDRF
jgi:hypothetical protein